MSNYLLLRRLGSSFSYRNFAQNTILFSTSIEKRNKSLIPFRNCCLFSTISTSKFLNRRPTIAEKLLNYNLSFYSTSTTNSSFVPNPSQVVQGQVTMRPPGVQHNLDFRTYKPEDIDVKLQETIKILKNAYDSIENTDKVTKETVLDAILEANRVESIDGTFLAFGRYVSDDVKLREASLAASKTLDELSVELDMRKGVFDKLQEYSKISSNDELSQEQKRALDRLIINGKRNGLHLDESTRDQVKEIKKEISNLQLKYSQNLNEDKVVLLFDGQQLDGMPTTFLNGLEKDATTGKYKVTLKYPDYFPIIRKCRIPETRKEITTAYLSRSVEENTKLIEDILELRQKEATLLGYENHGAYILELSMAKNPQNVKQFLLELGNKLKPLWLKDRDLMLDLKKKECEKYEYEFNGKLDSWDVSYYSTKIEEDFYTVDQEQLKEYFPLDAVTKGMLEIYEEILGLNFTLLPDAEVWHEDVVAYKAEDKSTKEVMGYFYLDLFPREGKYGHACAVPLQCGILNEGQKLPSCAIMLANFSKPQNNQSSQLDHKEVETYFHELGHVMHSICSKSETALFFGTRVERDFVECPSQMLENWVWEPEGLKRMSKHYKTQEPLPDNIIENLVKSQLANAGSFNTRQVILATFDQMCHEHGKINTAQVYSTLQKEMIGIDTIEGTNFAAQFNHIAAGYSARYYGYLWSEVFAADMFKTKFKASGIFSKTIGEQYRKSILEPGGSKDAKEMIFNFLGRDSNNEAFCEKIGISQD